MELLDCEHTGRYTVLCYGQKEPWAVEWKVMVDDWGKYGPKWIYQQKPKFSKKKKGGRNATNKN